MDWKAYEAEITRFYRDSYPDIRIVNDARLVGRFSQRERQIDLLIEGHVADFPFRIAIDGKYRNRKIDVTQVEEFISFLRDINVNTGVMIAPLGYTAAAEQRAHNDDMDIELDVLSLDEPMAFQSIGGIPFVDEQGVVVPAPIGWILDIRGFTDGTSSALATLCRRGRTIEEAVSDNEWMYVQYWMKDARAATLPDLMAHQEGYLRKAFSDATFEYRPLVDRKEATLLRIMRTQKYPTPEYTGFVEFQSFIFYGVLFSPETREKLNLRKLRYIMSRCIPIPITHSESGEPPVAHGDFFGLIARSRGSAVQREIAPVRFRLVATGHSPLAETREKQDDPGSVEIGDDGGGKDQVPEE